MPAWAASSISFWAPSSPRIRPRRICGSAFGQTQNAILTAPGDGIWKTNTGAGALDRRYFDSETAQAEFFGTIKEGDTTAIVSLRIKLHDKQIGEAEWHVARADSPDIMGTKQRVVYDLNNLLKYPPPKRVVAKDQRRPRDELVAGRQQLFRRHRRRHGPQRSGQSGLLSARGRHGVGPTGRAVRYRRRDADFESKTDCRTGYGGLNIVNVAARRYLMVDDEAQVVVASTVFVREPLSPKRRNCFMEVFVMDGGKISQVYAAMVYADPKLPMPNWEPYEGNYPISQNLILHP